MRLTTKAQVATKALTEIHLMSLPSRYVKLEDIHEEVGVSISYLESVMKSLKASGLVIARRGPEGGYQLAKPAEEIIISEVVESVDGPLVAPKIMNHFHIALQVALLHLSRFNITNWDEYKVKV